MDEMMLEDRRIRSGDVLHLLYVDLCAQAIYLRPCGDDRTRWQQACGEVLAAVPDRSQRVCWAYYLASALARCRCGVPISLTVQELLELAER